MLSKSRCRAFPSSFKALPSSIAVSKLVMQFLLGTKPCCSSANRLFLVKCSIMNTLMINSNSLHKADVIIMGRYLFFAPFLCIAVIQALNQSERDDSLL